MSVQNIRRQNLVYLVRQQGSSKEFAKKVGTSPAYVSQVISEKTRGEVGERLARAVEIACALETGWMDEIHDGATRRAQAVPVLPDSEVKKLADGAKLKASVDSEIVPTCLTVDESTFAWRLLSDDMSPKIPAGSVLIVEPDLESRPGDVVLITGPDGGIFVRELSREIDGSIVLKCGNTLRPVLPPPAGMKIIGVVREFSLRGSFR
ncbi:MAG: hypothetical protein JWR21_4355 [Herminiimonas sp.]|nr:hypothetical protein [Herminiimonas sp.]